MTGFCGKAFIKSFCKMGSADCQRREVQVEAPKSLGVTFKTEVVSIGFSFNNKHSNLHFAGIAVHLHIGKCTHTFK